MPVVVDGEGYICTTCYEIIPEPKYVSHRRRKDCHSPAQPPEAEQDNLSCIETAQRIESSCSTCHREFAGERAKDMHEPCGVIREHVPTEVSTRWRPKTLTLTTAAEIRRRNARISAKAANKIIAYRATISKPNTKGTYNVNGKVMSTRDIKHRIQRLSSAVKKRPVRSFQHLVQKISMPHGPNSKIIR